MGILKSLVDGIYNLILGLKVTAGRLPERAVTLQYPKERWEMPERSRGIVVLLSDKETGKLNCTACTLCQKACPTAAINIERERGEDKKWHIESFTVDNTICCFCGLCEESCNFAALKMAGKYEFSVYDQSELVWDVKKLQDVGRDVPYTPLPKKKKPAPKPAPAKPAEGDVKPEADVKPKEQTTEPAPKPEEKPEPKTEAEAKAPATEPPVQSEPEIKPEETGEQVELDMKDDDKPEDKKPEAGE